MSINIGELKKMLDSAFPNSDIEVIDTVGDGQHLEATLYSDAFAGKPQLQRHKMVYDSLGGLVGNEIHALALNTYTKQEKSTANTVAAVAVESSIDLNDDVLKQIDSLIKENKIVLFMKGNKDMPLCGFSSVVNHILLDLLKVDFVDVDVMADFKIREKIKEYSDWPTIPQLYIDGQFIGGCDIVRGMYQNGELQDLLKSKNITFSENHE
jgi:monothiol glutaredoxin